jgi:membrane protease YdiL (CAAX protease family)
MNKVGIFLVLTAVLTAIAVTPVVRAGDLGAGNGLFILATMWSPGVAAILTRLVTQRNLRGMGWIPRRPGILALAYGLPVAYALPVYLVAWTSGLGGFDASRWAFEPGMSPATGLLMACTIGAAMGLISATGEEIGWRGLLVPELAKITTFGRTALISGAIWTVFHLPGLLGANYRGEGTPLPYSLACFTVMIVSLSFVMAWITLKSGSFWPAAVLHATHNLFVQAVFDGATIENASTNWLTGEFGAGLAITTAITAWLLMRLGGIPAPQRSEPTGETVPAQVAAT